MPSAAPTTAIDAPSPPLTPTPRQPPTPTPRPTLHVGGLATVAVNHLQPVGDPERPEEVAFFAHREALRIGSTVFIVGGRELGDWHWQVTEIPTSEGTPFGFVPDAARGVTTLSPYRPECPDESSLTAVALAGLGGMEALVCFGRRELELTGDLACLRAEIDWILAGPPFIDYRFSCLIDDEFHVNGPVVTSLTGPDEQAVRGRYVVRGHFDDPGAEECGWIPFGTSGLSPRNPGEPGAVLACRGLFVVNDVQPVGSP